MSPPPQHPEEDTPARHQHGPQFICKQQITSADKLQTAIYRCIRITCIYVCVHIYTYICIQKYIHFFFLKKEEKDKIGLEDWKKIMLFNCMSLEYFVTGFN